MVQAALNGMFPRVLDMKLLDISPERIQAEVMVTEDICTTGHAMHGGAIMTLADFLGASGTFLNLPPGAGTTTLESKTNFIAAAPAGQKVTATAEPIHRGKTTQVWRTTVTREDGRVVAIVTQTQMVLTGQPSNQELLASLFAGKPLDEQKALLAQLERAGAGLYQAFAAAETDEAKKAELLAAAQREIENAETLEGQ